MVVPFEDQAEGWNKISPTLLDITGGEPFVFPNFVKMLDLIGRNIHLSMTSNLSSDLTEFVSKIGPERVWSFTASYHPSQKMSLECFMGKLMFLKNRGYKISVNFVAHPEQMWLIPKMKSVFEGECGVSFHVDRYCSSKCTEFEFNDVEDGLLGAHIGTDRSILENYKVLCSAGMDRIVVFPDGMVYRCLVGKLLGEMAIGKLGGEICLNREKQICCHRSSCAGCDRDHVTVEEVV